MTAMIVGIGAILFALIAVLPFGLGWWSDALLFLRGALPVLALFVGLIALCIGIADIRDRLEARREGAEEDSPPGSDGK